MTSFADHFSMLLIPKNEAYSFISERRQWLKLRFDSGVWAKPKLQEMAFFAISGIQRTPGDFDESFASIWEEFPLAEIPPIFHVGLRKSERFSHESNPAGA